jgi:hypothetical protein
MLLVLGFAMALLGFPTESKAQITLVRSATGLTDGAASVTATFTGAAPTPDNLLIAIAAAHDSRTINAPTSGGWSTAINQAGTPSQAIFYKKAGAAESTTVTVTVTGGNTDLGLHIYEYSGIALTSPLNGTASATGSGTMVSSGTIANRPPGSTNDLLIAGLVINTNNAPFSGQTNSFTELNDFNNQTGPDPSRSSYAGEARLSSATNNETTATNSKSGAWRGQIAAFRSLAPTAVEMVGYVATAGRDGKALLQWETGREVNNLGFNIYREDGEKRVRLNKSLIVGSGLTARPGTVMSAGRSYAWLAPAELAKGSVLWIEEIDFSGNVVWHGPILSQEVPSGIVTMSEKQRAVLEQTATVSDLVQESTNAGITRPVETFANPAKPSAMKITGAFISPQPPVNPSKSSIKISLKQEGWYRIGQPQLVAAGLNQSVDPNSLQLFADGAEVPMSVTTNNGAFDSTAAIEFYGLPIDTPSTDTHVYTLIAGSAGNRVQSVTGQGGLPSSNSFLYTVERKDRTIYVSGIHNGDAENFFGSVVSSSPTDQALTLKNVDVGAPGQATIEIGMQGLSLTPHVVSVSLNGNPIGTMSYDSQAQGVAQFTISNNSLLEGQNLVTLSGQQGVLDLSLVDHIRVSYWHTYAADGNALKFTAMANEQVMLTGFTSSDVRVFDVTNPNLPTKVEVSVTSQSSSPAFVVTVAVPGTGTRTLLAIANDQTRSPLGVVKDNATTWKSRSNAANLVIITHDSLKESFKQLQTLRQSQGFKVALVDVDDIYDEFNFGNKSPQAIKDFLAYAKANWKTAPKYVLLAGSASYDRKNYNGLGGYDLVPTKLIDTSFSETASDDWFADFNLDGIAEMAVGRLPVPTSDEAETTILKLMAYQNGDSFDSSLLVADGNDEFDFEAANSSLASLFPGSISVQQINRGQIGTATARQQLLDGIARGQKIVNYVGHGTPSVWRDNLLTAADALALTNSGRYPVFISMTCLNGEFHHPELNPLASALMNSREGGAIAVWASSGFTAPTGQAVMNQQFYTLLFPSNQPTKGNAGQATMTLGEITMNAKSSVSDPDIRRTWILFGDPSMRVK